MDFYLPTRLYSGTNCISRHQDAIKALGNRCMLVIDPLAAKASGALGDVEGVLATNGIESFVWDGVAENPSVESCIEAGRLASQKGAEFVIGVGGGSALDAAKAASVFLANPELDEDGFYSLAWINDPAPIALVGTTAGTGSEVTKVSVLTDANRRKHSIHDDRLYAAVSFGDSRHTHTCPASVTLSCGVDVLAHAIESYFSRKADPISRAYSIQAVRLAWGPLEVTCSGKELDAAMREQLYDASILGGMAINTTGTCFPHNVGYYLTENYGVPHGFASAIFLPALLACVNSFDREYASEFYDAVAADPEAIARIVESCLPDFDIRMTPEEIALAVPRWRNNGSVMNTRAEVSAETIHELLLSMFAH